MKQISSVYIKIAICCCNLLILAACNNRKDTTLQHLPYYNTPDFTPLWINDQKDVALAVTHSIGTFSLTDQNGKMIDQNIFTGKIHVAGFFFTSCSGICPVTQSNFKILQDTFLHDDNIVLLSFSVTPRADTQEQLLEYATANGVNGTKWHLLTGDKEEIYHLARTSYFAEKEIGYSKDGEEFLHTEHFILADQEARIRGIYNGTLKLEMQRLINDIRLLENESNL